ncbi:Golgi-associated plant pathogenesis protein 1 [Paragonimus heterotremus]|uniref:Golgi-associated plant pathogenesis protein 1 n=1 Tax=Paragonimus heterotremus TaxID=100268 RepID=A0A8J4T087_9TREM|nr:Golgi-associated plant pathogenesis protein 1 [Paragonimus heterotremus]
MIVDEDLARGAQEHAEYLVQLGRLEHSNGDYGENIAFTGGTCAVEFSGTEATDRWYKEIENYQYESDVQLECGHFTQVVWKESTSAGFGRASNEDGTKVYIVGRYYPPGNFEGQCTENVPKPLDT